MRFCIQMTLPARWRYSVCPCPKETPTLTRKELEPNSCRTSESFMTQQRGSRQTILENRWEDHLSIHLSSFTILTPLMSSSTILIQTAYCENLSCEDCITLDDLSSMERNAFCCDILCTKLKTSFLDIRYDVRKPL